MTSRSLWSVSAEQSSQAVGGQVVGNWRFVTAIDGIGAGAAEVETNRANNAIIGMTAIDCRNVP